MKGIPFFSSVFLWRDSVIYKILTNSIYKGERLFVGKVYNSPVIISPEIFDSVQLLLKKRNYLYVWMKQKVKIIMKIVKH